MYTFNRYNQPTSPWKLSCVLGATFSILHKKNISTCVCNANNSEVLLCEDDQETTVIKVERERERERGGGGGGGGGG